MSGNLARVVKYGLYGSVAIGGTVAVVTAKNNDDLNSIALVRLYRTASTALEIGRMYKKMLYSKEWDKNSKEYIEIRHQAHTIGADKLLELCKANKGVYIKVGQHLGSLDYLLPNEYVDTMRILHKDAPKNEVEQLYKVIEEDLKVNPNTIFTDFEREPLGTASLAQVHKAKLKDGTDVAVKVQHYFVRDNIELDIKWMEFVINVMSKVFPEFEMQWLVDETKRNIHKELSFTHEGQNAEKVAKMFGHYTWLKVPKIYWKYSSDRVLVMEYLRGGQVNDIKYIEDHNIDKLDLCKKIGDLYSHMIFVTGFVHSDPHPGNILVSKEEDDSDTTVYLLDHGLYAQLTDKFRYHYSKLWLSIMSFDREQMRIHSESLGIPKELYGLFACIVTGRPWETIVQGIGNVKPSDAEKSIFQDNVPNFMHQITQCLQKVDRQALLVLKTNDLIRSIEFSLGMKERMPGFQIMFRCCTESVYKIEYKASCTLLQKSYLNLKYAWTLLLLYAYGILLNLRVYWSSMTQTVEDIKPLPQLEGFVA